MSWMCFLCTPPRGLHRVDVCNTNYDMFTSSGDFIGVDWKVIDSETGGAKPRCTTFADKVGNNRVTFLFTDIFWLINVRNLLYACVPFLNKDLNTYNYFCFITMFLKYEQTRIDDIVWRLLEFVQSSHSHMKSLAISARLHTLSITLMNGSFYHSVLS